MSAPTLRRAPARPRHRVLGVFVVGGVLLAVLGLAVTKPDVDLGERMRPIYVHVPTVSRPTCCS